MTLSIFRVVQLISRIPVSPITKTRVRDRYLRSINIRLALMAIALTHSVIICTAQQMADPEFNTSVEHPAYTKNLPRVLFDEAHNNFHTTTGRYKPFADLIQNDGYHVVRNRQVFTKALLGSFKVLIIANEIGR